MPLKLSDNELDALDGLTDFQFRLYVRGVRRNMDFKTGLVGAGKYGISLDGLARETYISHKQGRVEAGKKSRFQIHRALKALEKAGLIELKSVVSKKEKQLILDCVLADRDESATNKPATNPQHYPATQAATPENQENPVNIEVLTDDEEESRNTSRSLKEAKPATYPVSGKDITDPIQDAVKNFGEFKNLLNDYGFRPNQILNSKTIAMIKAWIAEGITLDEAKTGIEAVNARGRLPGHPSYYLKPVMQVKNDFQKAQSEANDARQKPTKTNQQRHKSVTQSFWDDTTAALEQHYSRRNQPGDKPED